MSIIIIIIIVYTGADKLDKAMHVKTLPQPGHVGLHSFSWM